MKSKHNLTCASLCFQTSSLMPACKSSLHLYKTSSSVSQFWSINQPFSSALRLLGSSNSFIMSMFVYSSSSSSPNSLASLSMMLLLLMLFLMLLLLMPSFWSSFKSSKQNKRLRYHFLDLKWLDLWLKEGWHGFETEHGMAQILGRASYTIGVLNYKSEVVFSSNLVGQVRRTSQKDK